jgi:membrane protein DedA with SNARE-associated domain
LQIGYAALAGLVLGESVGIPVPGSTALVAAGILAADNKLNIIIVCVLGFAMTVAGANLAFAAGSKVGPRAFTRTGPFLRHREALLRRGVPIVERFGWLAAFASRFVPGLKECGALLVGALGMTWKAFLFWNTPGGLAWVLSHALLGFYLGRALGVSGSFVAIAGIELAAVALAVAARRVSAQRAGPLPVAEQEE